MDKKYQVFVSSTYADLKEERQKVIQALMEMDCIPSGMELFPAADEEQWKFIKRVIDDCDYYLLIIGGRYGSTTPEGISYTEKEYDYAFKKEMKVIALLHENPDEIPAGKSEMDPESRGRLKAFREKVSKRRLVKFWNSPDQLPGLVTTSLLKTMKTYPAVGWIRADRAASEELLNEINQLRKENEVLKKAVAQTEVQIPNLASLDEMISVSGYYKFKGFAGKHPCSVQISWRELFGLIAPFILEHPNDASVKFKMAEQVFAKAGKESGTVSYREMNDSDFDTIKVQFNALKLVSLDYLKTTQGGMALFWSLTSKGQALMIETRTVKKRDESIPGSPESFFKNV